MNASTKNGRSVKHADVAQMPSDSDWVSSCWRDMQERAAAGEVVRAEDYLKEARSDTDAVDLVYAEYVIRTERGESVSPKELLDRFPEQAEALRRQFALDGALSSLNGSAEETRDNRNARSDEADVPDRIGKYTVVALLSSGGQADVFRAVHPELSQEVVIKLAATGAKAAMHRQQLMAEGRILAEINHPFLGRVYDVGFDGSRPFLVSRYVRGRTLDEFAKQEALAAQDLAKLIAGVSRGLATAHRRGIAHLDIKPQNIVVDEQGQPCLIDFGLAITRNAFQHSDLESGSLRGTLPFMAPEQANGDTDRVGPRCDIFGLGAVLYYLATGTTPYANDSFPKVLDAVQRGAWRRDVLDQEAIPTKLRRIITTALDTDPDRRYRNCDEFAHALEQFAHEPSVTRRWAFAASGALALATLGLSWQQGWLSIPSAPPPLVNPPRISLQVANAGRFIDIAEVAPLETGDRLRISSSIPSEYHATLFLLTSEGSLKELCRLTPSTGPATLRYPEQPGQAVPLTGLGGTEVVFLCARRDGPIALEDFQHHCGEIGQLPRLPALSVMTADLNGVYVRQTGRDFGAPEHLPDPEDAVKSRLDDVRRSLSKELDFLHAIAFCHAD